MNISGQNSEPRIFYDKDKNKHEVGLASNTLSASGNSLNYDTRTKQRITQNEILRKSGRFLNVKSGERIKALEYLRKKINEKASTSSEIWLWDPFLDYSDIFETLYYVGNHGVKLKCISSYKKYRKRLDFQKDYKISDLLKLLVKSLFYSQKKVDKYKEFKEIQKKEILNNSNNLGISLDFRAVHDQCGFDFHDRFLFFIPKNTDEIPTVYSLGTSINSLGKSHHLIQQTLDPRKIIQTFRELWELLDNKESSVIKLPEDLKNER